MKKLFSKFILSLFGWKVESILPANIKKCVVLMAPHTSNWDFFIGWLGYHSLGLRSRYLIKKEAFFFPAGHIIRAMGAIPVDRQASTNIVHQVVEMYKKTDNLFITITPEGSRSLRHNWKRGYYHIAVLAGVPLVLSYLDYKKKIGGIGMILYPSGNYDADFEIIKNFYQGKNAKHPEKFSLSEQNRR